MAGLSAYPGIWFGDPYLSFGVGFGIGFFVRVSDGAGDIGDSISVAIAQFITMPGTTLTATRFTTETITTGEAGRGV